MVDFSENVKRVSWTIGLLNSGIPKARSMKSEEKSGGRSAVGSWWNVMEGLVVETVLMYLSVEPVSKGAGEMKMTTESEGW